MFASPRSSVMSVAGVLVIYLSEKINFLRYNQAGTAIWAIVAVVWVMDSLSAEVRNKIT